MIKKSIKVLLAFLSISYGGSLEVFAQKTDGKEKSVMENNVAPVKKRVAMQKDNPIPSKYKNTKEYLYKDWHQLLQKYVTASGKVNYKGFLKDIGKLNTVLKKWSIHLPNNTWSISAQKAYWINVYNAGTILLILKNYPLKSIKDLKKPWNQRFILLGKKWYHLNEIEHQILRKMGDARIHFGINCASISCPKLSNIAFTPKNIDKQLDALTRGFIADTSKNTLQKNHIIISKIFQWFAKDFRKEGGLIHFLNQYSAVQIAPNAKKKYQKYNWGLNE